MTVERDVSLEGGHSNTSHIQGIMREYRYSLIKECICVCMCVYIIKERNSGLPTNPAITYFTEVLIGVVVFCMMILSKKN